MVMILLLFWLIGIDISFGNLLLMSAYGIISNFVFCGQGYFLGFWIPNENDVKTINWLFIMVWFSTNGVLVNLGSSGWFIEAIGKVSPSKFNCEGFYRSIIRQISPQSIPLPYGGS